MGQGRGLCSWLGSSILMDSKLLRDKAKQIPDTLEIKIKKLIFLTIVLYVIVQE